MNSTWLELWRELFSLPEATLEKNAGVDIEIEECGAQNNGALPRPNP